MNRRITAVGLAVAASLALTSCAGAGGGAAAGGVTGPADTGGTIQVLASADFSHLDPEMGYDTGVQNLYRLIYRTLTTVSGKDGATIAPDLATDTGTPNADATVWTFTLKDGLKFEDGSPITSESVKFGVERAFEPSLAIGSPYSRMYLAGGDSYQGPYISGDLPSIETPDEKTIVFHLNRSVPEFASVAAQSTFTPFPADPAKVTATSIDQQPIASGPYKVTARTPGSSLTLERNTEWDQATDDVRTAKPDVWQFDVGLDQATIDERMIAGQGDDKNAIAGGITAASVSRIQTPEIKSRTVTGDGGCTTYLALNTTKPHLDDPRVRQAIAYAVDKKSVIDVIGGPSLAVPASTMLTPTVPGHKDFDLYPSTDSAGDVEKAKALLKEAGVEDGFTITLDQRNLPTQQKIGESLQQSLAKVGITVEFNIIDTATYYETIGTTSQQHDAAVTGWCPDWRSASTVLPTLFDGRQISAKGNNNVAQLNDPAVNAKIDEISSMTDLDAANAAWGDLDEQIQELAPTVPLYFGSALLVLGANVRNAYADPYFAGGVDFATVGLHTGK
ncbi:ABC transporter substrate-binding protein [Clavibacter phaseoli]|uniref:ABC transporter substrate-binding protein n=1 Tax=Clavibacter phaseoli TaxID=1734031 RepID=UPI000E666251|nr:ABC transporter substrate-binding protein [Clavibacter phaseoli]MBM7389216.1 peptide/nickel transport system substrate-binding protein [Clavibacter michiganensis]RIJ56155.1 ABC transporter substrate-binding protein [Clavibacter phaseoli]RIJ58892.1 ABC transporter substrate-binding protein [Clavibacter phaseoli]UKF31355.1 ABC transporter substrate-binding protein [Clavibacter phaseoli]UKF37274.1 ABC transporter substrate-binding protein [Clavibacter phaseoli]